MLNTKIWWQVMYDATGVRLQAGRQAEVICFFVPFPPSKEKKKRKKKNPLPPFPFLLLKCFYFDIVIIS